MNHDDTDEGTTERITASPYQINRSPVSPMPGKDI